MAKNFAAIYADAGDSKAIEQKFFVKEEVTKGLFVAPAGTDHLIHTGGSLRFAQPRTTSPHKTGRHHNNVIPEKTVTEWNIESSINIDTGEAAGATELDLAVSTLYKSLMGKRTISSGVIFTSEDAPSISMTIIENGDKWGKQAVGCFVNEGTIEMPGDGRPTHSFSGNGKTLYKVGIGKSTSDANAGNIITLDVPAEAKRFPVNSQVMIVGTAGVIRSADTPDGSPRKVTASNSTTGAITVDGAVLADADGSAADIYLCYYEPETPTAIDNPLSGLVGSLAVDNLPNRDCMRSASISINNNHELVDYCYGKDGLGDVLFVAGDRVTVGLDLEINWNDELLEWWNTHRATITADDIDLIAGDATSRHYKLDLPRVIFNIPEVANPETGSIPVTLSTENALQSALDAADELTISYL